MQIKYIVSINGPVIQAKGEGDFAMHDTVYISKEGILGEVIKLSYENTTGLKIGDEVVGNEKPLTLMLGPRYNK